MDFLEAPTIKKDWLGMHKIFSNYPVENFIVYSENILVEKS